MKRITSNFLKTHRACLEQRKLFNELYPKGINVCWQCFKEAQQAGLNVNWLLQYVPEYARAEVMGIPYRGWYKKFPALAAKYGTLEWTIWRLPDSSLKKLERAFLKLWGHKC